MKRIKIDLTVTGDDMAQTVINFCDMLSDHVQKVEGEPLPYIMADLSDFHDLEKNIRDAIVEKQNVDFSTIEDKQHKHKGDKK